MKSRQLLFLLACLSLAASTHQLGEVTKTEIKSHGDAAYNAVFESMQVEGTDPEVYPTVVPAAHPIEFYAQQVKSIDMPALKPLPLHIPKLSPVVKPVKEPAPIIAPKPTYLEGFNKTVVTTTKVVDTAAPAVVVEKDWDTLQGKPKPLVQEKAWKLVKISDNKEKLWSAKKNVERNVNKYLVTFADADNFHGLAAPAKKFSLLDAYHLISFNAPLAASQSSQPIRDIFAQLNKRVNKIENSGELSVARNLASVLQLYSEHVDFKNGHLTADPTHFGHLLGFDSAFACLSNRNCNYEENVVANHHNAENHLLSLQQESAEAPTGFFSELAPRIAENFDAPHGKKQASKHFMSDAGAADQKPAKGGFFSHLAQVAKRQSAVEEMNGYDKVQAVRDMRSLCECKRRSKGENLPDHLSCVVSNARLLNVERLTASDAHVLDFVQRMLDEWREQGTDRVLDKTNDFVRILSSKMPENPSLKVDDRDAHALELGHVYNLYNRSLPAIRELMSGNRASARSLSAATGSGLKSIDRLSSLFLENILGDNSQPGGGLLGNVLGGLSGAG